MPLSVKILPSEKTKTETTKEKYEADEKPDIDRALSTYTGWLAVFTAALFVAAGVQVGFFWWQLRLIRDAAKLTKEAADAAAKGARAAELNAEAVIDAERARIFVSVDRDTTDSIRAAARYVNSPEMDTGTISTNVGLFYSFKNYGKTPAILKEISHQIVLAPELAKLREYVPIAPLPLEHILGPSERTPDETLTCNLGRKITVGEAKQIQTLNNTVWFYGYISYDDTFGFGRELRYIFHYDGSTAGRFRLYSYREIQSVKRHQDQ